jgi:hypothetical protein
LVYAMDGSRHKIKQEEESYLAGRLHCSDDGTG